MSLKVRRVGPSTGKGVNGNTHSNRNRGHLKGGVVKSINHQKLSEVNGLH